MKTYHFEKIILSSILLGLSQFSWAACDQTLSPGANVASAVSSAANGTTICLNSGDYGSVNFNSITRSGFVTLQSSTVTGAIMTPNVTRSSFIKFQGLTLRDMKILNCSSNIQVLGNTWTQNTTGIVMNDHGYNCPATNKQILVDGNKFINTQPAWSEGKLGIVSVNGVTISNNVIQGQSSGRGGDGIQIGGNTDNITISGNIFRDILQGPCQSSPGVPHCDAIQFVTNCGKCVIDGNWFDKVEVVLQNHDADAPVIFTNNLVTNAVQMWIYSNPGNVSNSRIEHNTFYNLGLAMWGRSGSNVSDTTGLVARNNILLGSTNKPGTCNTPSCTFTHNVCQSAAQCSFNTSNTTIASPSFVGGSPNTITTWAGWQLTSSSVGYKNGSDNQDIGINYYGSGTATAVNPPATTVLLPGTNLRTN